jgi:hypothetical protein
LTPTLTRTVIVPTKCIKSFYWTSSCVS